MYEDGAKKNCLSRIATQTQTRKHGRGRQEATKRHKEGKGGRKE